MIAKFFFPDDRREFAKGARRRRYFLGRPSDLAVGETKDLWREGGGILTFRITGPRGKRGEAVLSPKGRTWFRRAGRPPRRSGFSLLEMLIVVAVVAILAALVVSTVRAVRSSANSAKCVANLRQIGSLMYSYLNDHDGYAPPHSGRAFDEPAGLQPESSINWAGRLAPYFEPESYYSPISSLFTCPSDPDQHTWPEVRSYIREGIEEIPESAETWRNISYGYNYVTFTSAAGFHPDPPSPRTRLSRVQSPSSVLVVADSMPVSKDGINPSVVFWFNSRLWPDTRHRGSFNALFLDGSVRWLPYEEATSKVSPTGLPYWSWQGFYWATPDN